MLGEHYRPSSGEGESRGYFDSEGPLMVTPMAERGWVRAKLLSRRRETYGRGKPAGTRPTKANLVYFTVYLGCLWVSMFRDWRRGDMCIPGADIWIAIGGGRVPSTADWVILYAFEGIIPFQSPWNHTDSSIILHLINRRIHVNKLRTILICQCKNQLKFISFRSVFRRGKIDIRTIFRIKLLWSSI